jgi:hypothetical protein
MMKLLELYLKAQRFVNGGMEAKADSEKKERPRLFIFQSNKTRTGATDLTSSLGRMRPSNPSEHELRKSKHTTYGLVVYFEGQMLTPFCKRPIDQKAAT